MCLGVVVIFVDGALLGLRANHENIQKLDIFLSHDEPMGTAVTLYGVQAPRQLALTVTSND